MHLADRRIEEALLLRATHNANAPALVDLDRVVSFGELLHNSTRIADQLRARGVVRGDRVAVLLDKNAEAVACTFAVWLAGGVVVPIAPTLRCSQIDYILSHSDSSVLLSTSVKLRRIGYDTVPSITLEVEPVALGSTSPAVTMLAPDSDEAAAILYTSGSTGMPKGVVISHENLCAGSRIVSRYLGLTSEDRILSVLPFSFDYGLNQLLTSIRLGGTIVLQRSLLATDILKSFSKYQITVMAGVPTLWVQLQDLITQEAAPALRLITNSGGVFPVDLVQRYRKQLPACKIFLMYGLTEAFRSTYLPPEELDRRPNSMGKAIPETEIFVIDSQGRETAPEEVGELIHRGPTVALGYWKDPETTRAKYRPDPLSPSATKPVVYSGDLVRRDAEGFLYFVGRNDEMLKAYGYRMSPTEVEAVVIRSGLVKEVVVGGVPDQLAGMRVIVHCVPSEGFTVAKLLEFCHAEMPSYMIPKEIVTHEDFPRTSSRKVDRSTIIKSYKPSA